MGTVSDLRPKETAPLVNSGVVTIQFQASFKERVKMCWYILRQKPIRLTTDTLNVIKNL